LKGVAITPELRNGVALAAKKKRMTQTAWVAEVLTRETQAILTGADQAEPKNRLPARRIDELETAMLQLTRKIEALADNAAKEPRQVSNPIQSAVETATSWLWGTR